MEFDDIAVKNRLFVGFSIPPGPIGLGIGPTAIPGSAYLAGPVLIGNNLTYSTAPNVNEANLMVARCANPFAIPPPPSIFKVSSRTLPPTPIDVMLGDPTGHIGITVNSLLISIFNDTNIAIISPFTSGVGVLNWVGIKNYVGATAEAAVKAKVGVQAQAAAEARSGPKCTNGPQLINGPLNVDGPVSSPWFRGGVVQSGRHILSAKKDFDIPHPTKSGWRLRHVCIEGPTADVYVRGKLEDSNIINLPSYWEKLVDPESITVSITPIGQYQEIFVEKIESWEKIILKNNSDAPIKCFYTVCGERIDVDKNIPEYEGEYDDYPGNNAEYMNSIKYVVLDQNK